MSPTLVDLIPTHIMTTTKYSKNLTTLDLNKRSMRSRRCSPSLSPPICRRPTFSICRRRSHWLCTYINPIFYQPLPSRSPTKRHVYDFISWLLFGNWIPGPHRGLDRSIHRAQTMESVSLGVSVISSSSLGAGAHLCSINTLTFLDQRNQHTYLLRHFILPIPFHPTLFSVQHPSVGHTVQLSLRPLPTTTLPTRTLNYVPTFFCCFITSSSLFSYLFVLSDISLMCTFRNWDLRNIYVTSLFFACENWSAVVCYWSEVQVSSLDWKRILCLTLKTSAYHSYYWDWLY